MDNNFEKWDEFKWESVFKDEDMLVNTYLGDLPKYLDMPDEDEVLYEEMQRLRKNLRMPGPQYAESDYYPPENEWMLPEDWEKKDGADIYKGIIDLSSLFSRIYASSLREENALLGLRILSFYGMILFRVICVMESSPEFPALAAAHCKRIASIMNDIVGVLRRINAEGENASTRIKEQISRLLIYREKTVELMCRLRKRE